MVGGPPEMIIVTRNDTGNTRGKLAPDFENTKMKGYKKNPDACLKIAFKCTSAIRN